MRQINLILISLIVCSIVGCSHSAYNSKIELTQYPDGRITATQWVGVGTISLLEIKDMTLKQMTLTDGSQLGQASSHTDPDAEAITVTNSSLMEWFKALVTSK